MIPLPMANDDREPADKDWMVARGWDWNDFLNFTFDLGDGVEVYLNLLGGEFQLLDCDGEDSPIIACRCRTRGDVRRIEGAFQLEAKEAR